MGGTGKGLDELIFNFSLKTEHPNIWLISRLTQNYTTKQTQLST